MCKMSILIGVYFLFCGCSIEEPKPSQDELPQDKIDEKISIPERPSLEKYPGCKLLASGYLVCPKSRR